jgi:hypothetical protein
MSRRLLVVALSAASVAGFGLWIVWPALAVLGGEPLPGGPANALTTAHTIGTPDGADSLSARVAACVETMGRRQGIRGAFGCARRWGGTDIGDFRRLEAALHHDGIYSQQSQGGNEAILQFLLQHQGQPVALSYYGGPRSRYRRRVEACVLVVLYDGASGGACVWNPDWPREYEWLDSRELLDRAQGVWDGPESDRVSARAFALQ